MKRGTIIPTLAAIATLTLTAQAFALGGGGRMGGSMTGSHQMSSTHQQGGGQGNVMQHGSTSGTAMQKGPINGTGQQSVMQGRAGNAAGAQHTPGSGMTVTQ
ncbi:hypothetical protein [Geobacter argillaceus]|uniref:Uncharacterized protein n=1 Tax=Geobacter argillaceus TaxID=345631 RepID=A0A562V837_9BACT|nr:hypothetical protein [Geobacter argillaceus]TWJ14074.1 hypothetical protein JN12_03573 [Geobacter argillaceus]